MANTIINIATGKTVLLLFIITNLVYLVMLLVTIPMTMEFSNGMDLLDMMPEGYDAEYVKMLMDTLGTEGRYIYLTRQIPADMIYPALFAICYCLVMAYFFRKLNKQNSSLFILCYLPLLAGLADYLENIGIISLLRSYPDINPLTVSLTSSFSLVKSISTTVFFVIILIQIITLGIKAIRRKIHKETHH